MLSPVQVASMPPSGYMGTVPDFPTFVSSMGGTPHFNPGETYRSGYTDADVIVDRLILAWQSFKTEQESMIGRMQAKLDLRMRDWGHELEHTVILATSTAKAVREIQRSMLQKPQLKSQTCQTTLAADGDASRDQQSHFPCGEEEHTLNGTVQKVQQPLHQIARSNATKMQPNTEDAGSQHKLDRTNSSKEKLSPAGQDAWVVPLEKLSCMLSAASISWLAGHGDLILEPDLIHCLQHACQDIANTTMTQEPHLQSAGSKQGDAKNHFDEIEGMPSMPALEGQAKEAIAMACSNNGEACRSAHDEIFAKRHDLIRHIVQTFALQAASDKESPGSSKDSAVFPGTKM